MIKVFRNENKKENINYIFNSNYDDCQKKNTDSADLLM